MVCVCVPEKEKRNKKLIYLITHILYIGWVASIPIPTQKVNSKPSGLFKNLVFQDFIQWVVIFATNMCNRKDCPGRAPLSFVDSQGCVASVHQAKYFAPFEMFLCRANYGMKSQKHSTSRLSGLGSVAQFWSSLLFRVGSTLSLWDLEPGFQDISLCEHSTHFLPTKTLPTSQCAHVWGQIKKPRIWFYFTFSKWN